MNTTWKQRHLDYLRRWFGKDADRWQDITTDDRLVYCNMYRMMIAAIESLPEDPNNYVCVAMNKELERDASTLTSIQHIFAGR